MKTPPTVGLGSVVPPKRITQCQNNDTACRSESKHVHDVYLVRCELDKLARANYLIELMLWMLHMDCFVRCDQMWLIPKNRTHQQIIWRVEVILGYNSFLCWDYTSIVVLIFYYQQAKTRQIRGCTLIVYWPLLYQTKLYPLVFLATFTRMPWVLLQLHI